MERKEEIMAEVLELVEARALVRLRNLLCEQNPADVAEMIGELNDKEIPLVFRILPKDLAGDAFSYMENDDRELLIRSFSDVELREILDELWLDDTVDIIEEMPANVVTRILKNTDPAVRRQINELLKYPEDSAGSIMTVEYVSLKKDLTVAECFNKIRRESINKETVYTCYVTEKRRLIGIVSVKDLLMANMDAVVSDIMETNVISIDAYDDKEIVAQTFTKYGMLALPVVDKEGRIVGIVTVDDAMDVIEEEATEDIERMAAITSTDKPYLKTGVMSIWLTRIPWLLLLMLSATFTGIIISSFETALSVFPVLISFIPMLMGTGGNAGGQSSATVIRGMAVGEIELKDILRVLWKELRIALLCGVTLAVVGFGKIILIDNLLLGMNVSYSEMAVVSLTLVVTVFVAKLVGCSLPILAKAVKLDPAVMASPFITTIVDVLSLIVYFFIAMRILEI